MIAENCMYETKKSIIAKVIDWKSLDYLPWMVISAEMYWLFLSSILTFITGFLDF